jgi:hypothetical protein
LSRGRDAFEEVGFDSGKLHGVDIRNKNTEEAVDAIKTLITENACRRGRGVCRVAVSRSTILEKSTSVYWEVE